MTISKIFMFVSICMGIVPPIITASPLPQPEPEMLEVIYDATNLIDYQSAIEAIPEKHPLAEYTTIDNEYLWYAEAAAARYEKVTPELLVAMMELESDGDPDCTSHTNAQGLMQIKPKFFKEAMAYLGITDLYDPWSNIQLGALIMDDLLSRHNLTMALVGYNKGENSKEMKNGKSTAYSRIIIKRMKELEQSLGKE